MNIIHIIKKGGFAIVMMSLSILFLVGCKDKTPKVKDLHYVNLQITKFSISKNNDTYLNNIQFAINQNYTDRKADAYIYNIQKLEYGIVIDSIKIDMAYTDNSVLSVEYSMGNNNDFKVFDPKKDSIFVGNNRMFKLKINPRDSSDKPRIYMVKLNQYNYESGTIDYENVRDLAGYPLYSLNKSINNGNNEANVFTQELASVPSLYVVNKDGDFTKKAVIGIPSEEMISNILYINGNISYAITNQGHLYKEDNRYAGFSLVSGFTAECLLGYIRINSIINLAIIKNDNDGVKHFATYDGTNITMGQVVPENFPLQDYYSINSSEQWVGDNIHLVGGKDDNNKRSSNVWYTTNGTDWIMIPQTGLPEDIERSAITKYNDEIYQLVITRSNEVKLFISSDNGASWKQDSVGLPDKLNITGILKNPFTIFSIDNYFYILVGKDISSSSLYKGVLRRLIDK